MPVTKEIEDEIRVKYKSGKLKDSHIKKFLKDYYDGNPSNTCPNGCSKDCLLNCYIEIQQALVSDYGERLHFKEPYIRDGANYCCGMEQAELPNGSKYCEVCGTEY